MPFQRGPAWCSPMYQLQNNLTKHIDKRQTCTMSSHPFQQHQTMPFVVKSTQRDTKHNPNSSKNDYLHRICTLHELHMHPPNEHSLITIAPPQCKCHKTIICPTIFAKNLDHSNRLQTMSIDGIPQWCPALYITSKKHCGHCENAGHWITKYSNRTFKNQDIQQPSINCFCLEHPSSEFKSRTHLGL